MTVTEVRAALRCRYRPEAWAFFEEVRNATGYGASRTADALAFNLWPSQGLELYGFEIKAYRGDWLNEIKHPEKADGVLSYCDRVFVVTTTKGMVKAEELPPTWGLMEPFGSQLRTTKPAEKNPAALPLDRAFVASVMRQAYRYIETEIANADRTKEAEKRGREEGLRERTYEFENMKRRVVDLEAVIKDFERESGVPLNRWEGGNIGKAVRLVLRAGLEDLPTRLRAVQSQIARALEEYEKEASGE